MADILCPQNDINKLLSGFSRMNLADEGKIPNLQVA